MPRVRILIVDSAPSSAQAQLVAQGGSPHGEIYAKALQTQADAVGFGLDVVTLAAANGDDLPPGSSLSDFDGVAWTGSPFSVYDDYPIVRQQIAFARAAFESEVPCFGSCWGLQVMSAALGGRVCRHVIGMEFGIGRRITLNAAGRGHGMFLGKPDVFDALSVHQDEVCALPRGARLLAGNDHCVVQAAEIAEGQRSFWGVQYHPEYDLRQMAALFRRGAARLVKEGFVGSIGEVDRMAGDFLTVQADASRDDLIGRYGLTRDIIDPMRHRLEFANWLRAKVGPRATRGSVSA